ncbi:MAG: alpha/beta hydrolase [Nocardiopsaceae bacterium]|nr:alpha/beta hydrolase [Nocardiopsaceae bacterium]
MYRILPADVPLRYTTAPGSARHPVPVLLLHGFGSSHESNWVRTGWGRALEGFPTVGLDLRGHGNSGKPHTDEAYTPSVFVTDIVLLLDALGIERVDIIGYSMGSRLAWELALARPDRVRRAVLGGFGPVNAFAGADLDRPGTDQSPFGQVHRAAAALPGNDPAALAACTRGQAAHPFTAVPAPAGTPLLFVAGERDGLADGMERLAQDTGAAGALRVARRDHRTTVSAQAFKKSAVEFLARAPAAFSAV